MTDLVANACTALTAVVKECSLSALENSEQFPKAFAMAQGIKRLRELITPELMKEIMPLMNTSLGFQTDRDPTKEDWKTKKPYVPYSEAVVKECFIEATLRGLAPVGNEWNILAGRVYATKNGLGRKLKELAGFTDFKPSFQVPKAAGENGAIVQVSATWKMNGVPDKLERAFPIKVNNGMGADAIVGKAERKLRAAVYEQITGSHLSDGDTSDEDAIPTTATKGEDLGIKEKMAAAKGKSETLTPLQQKVKNIDPKTMAQIRGELQLPLTHELTDDQCTVALRAAEALK